MTPPPVHVVGHGLAGAILAETASQKGLRIRVSDDGGPSSSRVAAGLFTPLTGQRLIPSWGLDEAYPVLKRFYPMLESSLGVSIFHECSTCRILRTAKQREEVECRKSVWAQDWTAAPPPFKAPFGMVEVQGGGWVNLPAMLDALKKRRQQRGEWAGPPIPNECTIWCQGAAASQDPRWKDVGWRIAHGDVLTVRIPGLSSSAIYNFDKFLLPIGNGLFRLGATYDWHTATPVPRLKGRQELEEALASCLQLPFEVVDHQAGLRPVALARVPVAGPHPEEPHHWIFNGFASKGVLLAPWMAECTVQALLTGEGIPKETLSTRRIQRQRDREKTRRGQAAHSTHPVRKGQVKKNSPSAQ